MRPRYYREQNGDYLLAFPDLVNTCGQMMDCRATAIAGLPSSVCTTGIYVPLLETFSRVDGRRIPREWRRCLNPKGQ